MIEQYLNRIINIDCKSGISALPDNSIDCVVTSPPYFRLRDYGISGQIGLEDNPKQYIAKLLEIFAEVYRVLKKEGTFWLNMGDSYARSGHGYLTEFKGKQATNRSTLFPMNKPPTPVQIGLKQKDLIGMPWMLAFALRESGWYLRQDIIWHKPNPMPESVKDRCTKSHEYIFLLTKSSKYYFDNEAIKEPQSESTYKRFKNKLEFSQTKLENKNSKSKYYNSFHKYAPKAILENGRNKRSVWTVLPEKNRENHFAMFPKALIIDCIKAGCPEQGIVLDPFMGSGTTAIVAKQNNRNYIGFELNPEYVQIAEKRIYLL